MIVVAGGMIRSGSTFAFNVIRELLARTGPVRTSSSNHLDESEWNRTNVGHALVKTHTPDERLLAGIIDGSAACICTWRRAEDAIASWSRTFAFSVAHGIEMVRTWHAWHERVREQVLTLDYDVVDKRPREAVQAIAEHLRLDDDTAFLDHLAESYEKQALKRRLDALAQDDRTVDVGFSYYDKETFFHRRHISADPSESAEDLLSAEQRTAIRVALGPH